MEECYDDGFLSLMLNKEFGEKERFVSGADISKLVSMAVRNMWNSTKISFPVDKETWKRELVKVLENTIVYGDSKENMDSIAVCYIRLLRSNFISASDDPLFSDDDYVISEKQPEDDAPRRRFPEFIVTVAPKDGLCIYDQKLRSRIKDLMESYGPLIEDSALRRML